MVSDPPRSDDWVEGYEAGIQDGAAHLAASDNENDWLRGLLARLEWAVVDPVHGRYCPVCEGVQPVHGPHCELAAVLYPANDEAAATPKDAP